MRYRKKLKQPNIHVFGVSEGRECSRKYIYEVNKSINSQIQEVQITPRMRNLEKITPKPIIIKLIKKNYRSYRRHITFRRTNVMETANFSPKLQAGRESSNTFKV